MNLSLALSLGKRPHLYCDNVLEDGRRCDYPLRLADGKDFWGDEPVMCCDACQWRSDGVVPRRQQNLERMRGGIALPGWEAS